MRRGGCQLPPGSGLASGVTVQSACGRSPSRGDLNRSGLQRWVVLGLTWVVCAAGVVSYLRSPGHADHDPRRNLQQLNQLYLDEPAPLATELGLRRGRPALVVMCSRCRAPGPLPDQVQVVVTPDRDAALAYGLVTSAGRLGPGYALVDQPWAAALPHVRPRPAEPRSGDLYFAGSVAVSPRRAVLQSRYRDFDDLRFQAVPFKRTE